MTVDSGRGPDGWHRRRNTSAWSMRLALANANMACTKVSTL
ncbi:MAG TPA: hypothetical protein VN886_02915 [Acidimicrobiales bacterium]|nr:hypothetical protein [Acidimicrobiales bacterium]